MLSIIASLLLCSIQVIDGVTYECGDDGVCRMVSAPSSAPSQSDSASTSVTDNHPQPSTSTSSLHLPPPAPLRMTLGFQKPAEFLSFLKGAPAPSPLDEELSDMPSLGTSLLSLFLAAILGGLLMNLTPCVLPLVPINLIIIGKSFRRGLAYGLGIALAYGALGLAAAFGGLAFGEIQSSPYFNAVVAVVFVLLALSLFDVFFIDLTRFRVKSGSAFVMGALSAVLAGACVAPILISILVVTAAHTAAGDYVALALPFALGLGMGLPWPFLGAGMHVLPKPGAWMKWVNRCFGLLVLGFAAWYGYLAYTGFVQGAKCEVPGVPPRTPAEEATPSLNLTPATFRLPESDKPILVDCWASWCKNCLAMEHTTLSDPAVAEALENFTVVRLQAESIPELRRLPGFEKVQGLPCFAIYAPKRLKIAYNYCTLSYTMAFWDRGEWRAEIDRLKASGFNVALVIAGLPKVWQLTLRDMGYGEDEIRSFIPGEAAQAWWAMGNLEGFGGPLSDKRIDEDARLARFITTYMRGQGIEPILNGFVGLVPSTEKKGKVFPQGTWNNIFTRPAVLDPRSPRFTEFARAYYRNLKKVYGFAPKYLGGDLFHEGGSTADLTPDEIAETARLVQRLQQEAFPGVIWVLQSWQGTPRPEIRRALDPAHSLIEYLDKDMSRAGEYNSEFGHLPWVWCEVMNFGGNTALYGGAKRFRSLARIPTGIGSDTFRGYGMLSEGLEQNAYMYALFADPDLTPSAFVTSRYGRAGEKLAPVLVPALEEIEKTAWNCPRYEEGPVENVLCALPASAVRNVSTWGPTEGTYYDRRALVSAAEKYLMAAEVSSELAANENFRNDFVELFMQILADRAREFLPTIEGHPERQAEWISYLALADDLASCARLFRLDEQEARRVKTAGEKGREDYRRMLTTWTPTTALSYSSGLHEYAHRNYAGLLRHYYLPRWQAFFDKVNGRIDERTYAEKLDTLGNTFPTARLPATPRDTDMIKTAKRILEICR